MSADMKNELLEQIKIANSEIVNFQSPLFIIECFIGSRSELKIKAIKELLQQLLELQEKAKATGIVVKGIVEEKISKIKKTIIDKVTLLELFESDIIDEDRLALAANVLCRFCKCKREEAEELELMPLTMVILIAEQFKIVEECTKFILELYENKWLEINIGFRGFQGDFLSTIAMPILQQDIVEYRFNGLIDKGQYEDIVKRIQAILHDAYYYH